MGGKNPPLDYSLLHETISKLKTQDRYKADWEKFVKWIDNDASFSDQNFVKNDKTKELILSYLRHRRKLGNTGNSIRTLLSYLSTMIKHFYDIIVSQVSHKLFRFNYTNPSKNAALNI
jgi:hypothetical protein